MRRFNPSILVFGGGVAFAAFLAAACANLSSLSGGRAKDTVPDGSDDGAPPVDDALDGGADAFVPQGDAAVTFPICPPGDGGTYCATNPTASYCNDFDDGRANLGFTELVVDPGASLIPVCSTQSLPFSLRAGSLVAAPGARAFARADLVTTMAYTRIILNFFVRPHAFPMGTPVTHIARLKFATPAGAKDVEAVNIVAAPSKTEGNVDFSWLPTFGATDGALRLIGSAAPNAWTRVRFVISFTAAVGATPASASVSANLGVATPTPVALAGAKNTESPQASFGLVRNAVTPVALDFDDVVVTLK